MPLRLKAFIIVAVIYVALAAMVHAAADAIIGQSYLNLEAHEAQSSLQQVLSELQDQAATLGQSTSDYAAWDDSYAFIAGHNPTYIERNLNDETFLANRFRLVLFVDQAGAIVYGKGFDLASGQAAPLPEPLGSLQPPARLLLDLPSPASGNDGLLMSSEGLLVVSARPILTSEYSGPARGTLIIGRALDEHVIEQMAHNGVTLSIHPLDAPMAPDVASASDALSAATPTLVVPLSEQTIASYGLLSDIAGQPVAILRSEAARHLYAQGEAAISALEIAMLLAGAVLLLAVVVTLDLIVLRPMVQLGRRTNAIGAGGDISVRLDVRGKDEIAALASDINRMLDALKQVQGQLQESKEAAEAANRAKSRFLANMSHELRTPLTAIIGYTELVRLEAGQDAPQLVPDLEKIRLAGIHLLALINDVLDLAKIEAGRMTVSPRFYPVESMIDEVVTTVRPMGDKNRNTIKVCIGQGLPELFTDATKLRQILLNLLTNACKFTSDGQIVVRAEPALVNAAPGIAFTVADTGIGMSPAQLVTLFHEFQQADAQTPQRFGGTGLGLALSRRLCHLLGGEISVSSALGEGSTFTVVLPAVIDEQKAAAADLGPPTIASVAALTPRRA